MNLRIGLSLAPTIAALAFGALSPSRGMSQQPDSLKFEDLRPPVSPAFVLLGIEPKSIERPKTPRAFVMSATQAMKDASGLPKNYAMEFSPYWLLPHPDLEFKPDQQKSVFQTIKETFSVSLATSTDSAASRTSLGVGLRFLLVEGGIPDTAKKLLLAMRGMHMKILETSDSKMEDSLARAIKPLAIETQSLLHTTGFRWEVAAGAVGSFADGSYESGELSRIGLWMTPSYQHNTSRFDATGLLRIIMNKGDRTGTNVDYGAKLSYDLAPLTIAYELIGRSAIDATITSTDGDGQTIGTFTLKSTSRSAGSVEYNIGGGSSVLFTFGRNYREGPGDKNLLASLSLNLGFGKMQFFRTK